VAAVVPPPVVAPVAALPKTASNLSLIGLLGLFTLGGGFLLSSFLRRIA
jgi:LPXTG-motif cell wall-anchored protein